LLVLWLYNFAGYGTFNEITDNDEDLAEHQSTDHNFPRVSTAIKRLTDVSQKLSTYFTDVHTVDSVDVSVTAGLYFTFYSSRTEILDSKHW
jgi:hypothetical protein